MAQKRPRETKTERVGDWRSKALEMLPELTGWITDADNPMGLWIEIRFAFDSAYEEPRNDNLIGHIYSFAHWCLGQPRAERAENDLLTCVIVAFYEHIPTKEASREDMPRWFTREEVEQSKQVFSYHTSADDYERLLNLFTPTKADKRKRH